MIAQDRLIQIKGRATSVKHVQTPERGLIALCGMATQVGDNCMWWGANNDQRGYPDRLQAGWIRSPQSLFRHAEIGGELSLTHNPGSTWKGELTVPFRVQAGERTTFQVEEVWVNPAVAEVIFERPGVGVGRSPGSPGCTR